MGRSPCCDESGLKKGPWTPEEDQKLMNYIQKNGHGSWRALPKLAGLNRCGKSCRLRWTNYLRPDIKRGKFSQEEEQTILNLHSILGNKWSAIASHLPGRTDNEIKNFWNTHLKKKLIQMGFDPMTHRPRTDIFSSLPHLLALVNLKELLDHGGHTSWDEQAVRLQAEAAQMARLQYLQCLLQPPPANNSFGAGSPSNLNDITDMETINLLSSLCSYQLDQNPPQYPGANFEPVQDHNSIPFSHLPDLQTYQTPSLNNNKDMVNQAEDQFAVVLSQGQNSPNNPWNIPSSSNTTPSPTSMAPPVAETSISNTMGDACSTSSFGGVANSAWSELLLEDSFFNEIA
ncbi:hypothetical protein PRUPE_6G188300 [Prunus persica]|uniref:Uncharacterized protein n=1 Tax=Prunus persica TaxID=3760 RepID=M5W526_PRUPE|nr:transcription factor MYB80 [Prunus persica]ONI02288.1 hypothetical protein PRUPE_6G188300 [Prunus persica]